MKYSFLFIIIFSFIICAQPKNEVRAVWITTAFNLDWPTTQGSENQQKEIINILDSLKLANFNTIYLQVRARGDLLYPSKHEPYAKSLTGKLGEIPGYDPLKYFIDEAHKRGFEILAWWNVYKVFGKNLPELTLLKHVVLANPELCKYYKDEWWMDPGNPQSNKYLLNLIVELVSNYDLDGINFDYMRYPDKDFNDDNTFKIYGNGKDKSKWRRENINHFVTQIYDTIISLKPYFKIGSSPLGVYKNKDEISNLFGGFENASQDSKKWIESKKQDFIAPQIFWNIESAPNYNIVLREWTSLADGKQVIAGIAAYKLSPVFENWDISEISAQIDSVRKIGADGISIYRLSNLINNDKGIYNLLKNDKFKRASGIASLNWKDTTKPNPPNYFKINYSDGNYLSIVCNDSVINEFKYYNFYLSKTLPVDIFDNKNIYQLRVVNTDTVKIKIDNIFSQPIYFVATALSRTNVESNSSEYFVINKKRFLGISILLVNNKKYFLKDEQLSLPIQN